ncbi:unnamed protein product [Cyprideis torosa]|uniref:Uncharacterized protein n=1 Tax=Cyprideis torosa TaxID=163714 RepID=A0A7R8WLZ8_9CRUS|nr:unnamed protein product [Cyprideis torosa]CAG0898706.1 unnamed protein product [Cyprideis torosa]
MTCRVTMNFSTFMGGKDSVAMSRHTEDPALLLAAISTGAFLGAGGVLLYLNHRREELNKLEATITARDSELQKKVAELQKQLDDVRFHRVDSFSGLSFYSCDDDDTLVEDLRSDEEVVAVSENITNELHIPNGEIRCQQVV